MSLGTTITIEGDELREVFARLSPHLPPYLRKIGPRPYNGLSFEFAPFTGRENKPTTPQSFYDDPKLRFASQSDDPTEHLVRTAARTIMGDLIEAARGEWRDAAHVADLKAVVGNAPDRWRTYERELKALEAAYSYLRTPEAAKEWPSALSRLVDAQDRTSEAAVAFDERAEEIARVHDQHLYADLGHAAALARAGCPDAGDWHIVSADQYSNTWFSDWNTSVPLQERTRRLVAQQDAHVAKVGRLSGFPG
ncbi:hypothetical protein [Streptomyces fuscichromogenes]|nr:hypothetical protein [Streptomyces fuscichromogenes]